jgi:hypothetical protein
MVDDKSSARPFISRLAHTVLWCHKHLTRLQFRESLSHAGEGCGQAPWTESTHHTWSRPEL